MSKINPENSLSVLLIATAALVIFSPLCAVGLLEDEQELLHLAKTNFGISNADFASAAYAAAIRFSRFIFPTRLQYAFRAPSPYGCSLSEFSNFGATTKNENMLFWPL